MSDLLLNHDFLVWTKGPAALQTMKSALCDLIRSVWIEYLEKFTADEVNHLEQFIEDMNAGYAKADYKKKQWKLKCGHRHCESLLKKLLEKRHNKKSLNVVWKTNCTSRQITHRNDMIGLADIFDHNRVLCKTYYWHIANMFMFYGGETNETPSSGPGDADVAVVLKMMKNCTLFEVDEIEIYDTVIGIRNRIFHTGQYNMTEKDMKLMIDNMTKLLKQVHKLPECHTKHRNQIEDGMKELRTISERKVVMLSFGNDWKYRAVQALEIQRVAIEFDISFRGTVQYDITSLMNILQNTQDRIQEYTNSEEWRQRMENKRREDERKRQEEEDKKIKELEEQIRSLQTRIQSQEEDLRNILI